MSRISICTNAHGDEHDSLVMYKYNTISTQIWHCDRFVIRSFVLDLGDVNAASQRALAGITRMRFVCLFRDCNDPRDRLGDLILSDLVAEHLSQFFERTVRSLGVDEEDEYAGDDAEPEEQEVVAPSDG